MTTRILALILGFVAGAVVLAICIFAWSDAVAVARIHAPDLVAALSVPANRVAWAVAAAAAACAVAALFTGLVGGIAETLIAARRIGALQAGPALAGWSCAGDWRTVFDSTAIAVAAGPILDAAVIPREGRAGGVDSISLLALGRLWLDHLTFRRAIRPLPLLVLSADIMLALISDLSGTGWELALAAGVAGWFLISLARYVTSLVLSPFIERTCCDPIGNAPGNGRSGIRHRRPSRIRASRDNAAVDESTIDGAASDSTGRRCRGGSRGNRPDCRRNIGGAARATGSRCRKTGVRGASSGASYRSRVDRRYRHGGGAGRHRTAARRLAEALKVVGRWTQADAERSRRRVGPPSAQLLLSWSSSACASFLLSNSRPAATAFFNRSAASAFLPLRLSA